MSSLITLWAANKDMCLLLPRQWCVHHRYVYWHHGFYSPGHENKCWIISKRVRLLLGEIIHLIYETHKFDFIDYIYYQQLLHLCYYQNIRIMFKSLHLWLKGCVKINSTKSLYSWSMVTWSLLLHILSSLLLSHALVLTTLKPKVKMAKRYKKTYSTPLMNYDFYT